MTNQKMPLAWNDNSLGLNPKRMLADYRFRPIRGGFTCEFSDYAFQSTGPHDLATLLVEDGAADGTLEIRSRPTGVVERYESLYALAARSRTHLQNQSLKIPNNRLRTMFRTFSHGLRPDVQEWWSNTLSEKSRAWRFREYSFSPNRRRATKTVREFLDFDTDADLSAFKLRWPELWC
jgi:hypothetical protein